MCNPSGLSQRASRKLVFDAVEHRLSASAPSGHSVRCPNFRDVLLLPRSAEWNSLGAHRPEGLCFPYQSNVNFGFLGLLLVFAQRWVDFFAPCVQAAFEINQILEAFAAQKRDRARAADARFAHHDGRFCPWNFCQSLRNRAKRNQLRVWNTRDLKFEWLAHVN